MFSHILFCSSLFYAANIFGIGDCTNVPTSRTAAACAAESAVIRKNLFAVMRGETPKAHVSVCWKFGEVEFFMVYVTPK